MMFINNYVIPIPEISFNVVFSNLLCAEESEPFCKHKKPTQK